MLWGYLAAMLELQNVNAGYGAFQALFDVSLEVAAGEAVAVIGPNGAGKTTLMRLISGLIPVRAVIHASEVSTRSAISVLVTQFSGRQEPHPTIRVCRAMT